MLHHLCSGAVTANCPDAGVDFMYRQILSVHALYVCCIYNTIARSAVLSFALVQCRCILLPVVPFLHIFSTFATFC